MVFIVALRDGYSHRAVLASTLIPDKRQRRRRGRCISGKSNLRTDSNTRPRSGICRSTCVKWQHGLHIISPPSFSLLYFLAACLKSAIEKRPWARYCRGGEWVHVVCNSDVIFFFISLSSSGPAASSTFFRLTSWSQTKKEKTNKQGFKHKFSLIVVQHFRNAPQCFRLRNRYCLTRLLACFVILLIRYQQSPPGSVVVTAAISQMNSPDQPSKTSAEIFTFI